MIERIKHRKTKRWHIHTKNCPPGCWAIYEHKYIGEHGLALQHYFEFTCPCGCGLSGPITIKHCAPEHKPEHSWAWNGDLETPTLYSSILCSGQPCKWHGFFEAGGWRSNGDGAPTAPNCVHRIG